MDFPKQLQRAFTTGLKYTYEDGCPLPALKIKEIWRRNRLNVMKFREEMSRFSQVVMETQTPKESHGQAMRKPWVSHG